MDGQDSSADDGLEGSRVCMASADGGVQLKEGTQHILAPLLARGARRARREGLPARIGRGPDRDAFAASRDLALSPTCSEKLRIRTRDLPQFASQFGSSHPVPGPSRRPTVSYVSPRRTRATSPGLEPERRAHTRGAPARFRSPWRRRRLDAERVRPPARRAERAGRGRRGATARAVLCEPIEPPAAARLALERARRAQRSITTSRYSHGTTKELGCRLWRAASSVMSAPSRAWPSASSAANALCIGP